MMAIAPGMDVLLFNGGAFLSKVLQQRIVDVVTSWYSTALQPWQPIVLENDRLELAVDTATPEMNQKLDAVKWDMLEEWSRTKKAPQHAAWMHEKH